MLNKLNLEWEILLEWPPTKQYTLLGIIFISLISLNHYYFISPALKQLSYLKAQNQVLEKNFIQQHALAIQKIAYEKQLKTLEQYKEHLSQRLVRRAELAKLVESISNTGMALGVNFKFIKPQAELSEDFYKILPIDIIITGSYHQFAEFISGLTALPKIVLINDFSMSHAPKTDESLLTLNLNLSTVIIDAPLPT